MKVELNTEELFCHDGQSAEDFIRDAVIEHLANRYYEGMEGQVKSKLEDVLVKTIEKKVGELLEPIKANFLDHEFVETTSWGENKTTWTVRNRILHEIEKNCVFKNTNYSSDRNAFTKAIFEATQEQMNQFKTEWVKQVDAKFMQEALEHAAKELKRRLPK